jgi:hypothetical protein
MTDQELTSSEKRALNELPTERTPNDLLEERVVGSLHERGLLRNDRGRPLAVTRLRVAAAIAASLLLVLAGFAVGRWTSHSGADELPTTARQAHEFAVAASLQQAAGAYMVALEDLEHSLQTTSGEQARQGREVALATLYSAANRVARVVPEDRLADRFRDALNVSARETTPKPSDANYRRVIEF